MTTTFLREVQLTYRGPRRGKPFPAANAPEKAAAFMRKILPDNVREHFLALFLNGRHDVAAFFVAATGTANTCPVGVRELFQAAIHAGAVSVIVGHNHPSNDANPSPEDRAVTKRLAEAGELLGIPLLDHVIVGSNSFYSFRESGELPATPKSLPVAA
ncbi:MAG: JAB domain-containing protein [Verrucomicrobiia bacterium]